MYALKGQAFYITCRCLRPEKPEVLRVNEMHSAVVMSGYGQILCLGGAPPVGSLSLVYMRRLDTGRPCATLPRVNGPPPAPLSKLEICLLSRQTMHQGEGGLRQACIILPLPLLIKHQHTVQCFWSLDFGLQSRQWLAVE